MSEQDLIEAIRNAYAKLRRAKRIRLVRELCEEGNRRFVKKFYPDFYMEAYPNRKP